MAKYSGLVGYGIQTETTPGVWKTVDTPRMMKGDFYMESSRHQNGDKVNDDISLNHRISLMGDEWVMKHYPLMRWIEIDGIKWEITSVELKRPRVIVNVGGLYNGDIQQIETAR